MNDFTLHRGDALTVLKTLPDESVNAVITDPPYNSGGRTSSERTSRDARAKYVTSGSAHDLKTFPGENRDQRSYRSWLTELLTEAYRASAEHAVAMVFSDWRQEPTTSDALQMAGWTWQGTIPWIKPASRPRKGGFKQSAEFITWGVKGTLDNRRNLYLPGHFIASQPRKDRVHITQKPLEIMQQLVQICPEGGTVLDPFTGSGSTGVAALREGRRFVGVELSPHYAEIAEQRLQAELTQDDFALAGPEA
ncbi:site-specific DNA-methyltransferase [Kitasatospora sp. NPDC006786]|uniref:DNA-methyltransferase n=1 Tax=unclassified Kitasatospora TaxID=2633591 RepID=UPI0033787473